MCVLVCVCKRFKGCRIRDVMMRKKLKCKDWAKKHDINYCIDSNICTGTGHTGRKWCLEYQVFHSSKCVFVRVCFCLTSQRSPITNMYLSLCFRLFFYLPGLKFKVNLTIAKQKADTQGYYHPKVTHTQIGHPRKGK